MATKPMVLTKENVLATISGRKTMTRRIINDQCLQSVPFADISPIMNKPPHQHDSYDGKWYYELQSKVDDTDHIEIKPRFQVGDTAFVAEGYQILTPLVGNNMVKVLYLADKHVKAIQLTYNEWELWSNRKHPYRATSGRFMYKSLARTFLPIIGVGVEQVQDITPKDILLEGIESYGWDYAESSDGTGDKFAYWADHTTDMPEWCPQSATSCECIEDVFSWLWNSIHGDGAWERNDWVTVNKWGQIEVKQ